MIYINQLGHCELGRGETLPDAIDDAKKNYDDLCAQDVRLFRPDDPRAHMDGDVVWTREPQANYN